MEMILTAPTAHRVHAGGEDGAALLQRLQARHPDRSAEQTAAAYGGPN